MTDTRVFCNSRLYMNGVSVNPMALYPPVELPVASSTPMLSSLVRWDHSSTFEVPSSSEFLAVISSSSVEVNVSYPDSTDAYLTGHMVDGRVVYPATGYLVLAWRQLARMNGQNYQQTPVCFDDVQLHRAIILPSTGRAVAFSWHVLFLFSLYIIMQSIAIFAGRVSE